MGFKCLRNLLILIFPPTLYIYTLFKGVISLNFGNRITTTECHLFWIICTDDPFRIPHFPLCVMIIYKLERRDGWEERGDWGLMLQYTSIFWILSNTYRNFGVLIYSLCSSAVCTLLYVREISAVFKQIYTLVSGFIKGTCLETHRPPTWRIF